MTLVPATPDDWPRVSRWLARDEVTRWMGPPLRGLTQLQWQLLLARKVENRMFAIEDAGAKVGLLGLAMIDPASASAEVWYLIGEPGLEGRGIATAAVREAAGVAFGALALHSLRAWVAEGNAASARVLEKLGFRPAGAWRECFLLDDRWVERRYFDLLAGEWNRATAASKPGASFGGK